MKKFIQGREDTVYKDSYVWNTIGGMLNAGQSALLLVIISRTNSIEDAGIFSIAYAIACLTVTVGKWGMRNFQATDIQEKYPFGVYVYSRVLTCLLMLLLTFFYIFKGVLNASYTLDKCITILLLALLKMLDAIEDIVHGMFQRKGRLDVGAKSMATRYIVMLSACGISLCLTHNLIVSLIFSLLISIIYFIFVTSLVYGSYKEKIEISFKDFRVFKLLSECFSLFIGSFLMMYVANAPKYAIDEYMDETVQACFNYIFMPVYIISMLNTFIYQPALTRLAVYCEEKKQKEFLYLFFRQMIIILGLTGGVMLFGFFMGIPILSILYNINLDKYKYPYMILLLGGGFLAISGYLSVVVTIFRKQNWLLIGYILAAVLAFVAAKPLTLTWGVAGASVLYMGIVFLQVLVFAIIFCRCYFHK